MSNSHPGIPYVVDFADTDVEGSALTGIIRANCYVRRPGSMEWEKWAEVPFATYDGVIRYFPEKDGDYLFYHTTVARSAVCEGKSGHKIDVIESDPGEVTQVTVNAAKPTAPGKGRIAFDKE